MKIKNVARYFDNVPVTDAYTGAPLFSCQIGVYDGNKRDSETAIRRVMSCAAEVVIPARRAINIAGTHYIVGHAYPDFFGSGVPRVGYPITEATDVVSLFTLGQLCRNESGTSVWAARAWIKNDATASQSSTLTPQFNLFFSPTESVPTGTVASFSDASFLVRAVELGEAGTFVCTSDQLSGTVIELATITSGLYDAVNDVIDGTPHSVRAVRMRWQSWFAYGNKAAPTFGPDDIQLVVAKSALTMYVGAQAVLSDGLWQIMDVTDLGDVWLCRATLHA